jgi:hypothetical protein
MAPIIQLKGVIRIIQFGVENRFIVWSPFNVVTDDQRRIVKHNSIIIVIVVVVIINWLKDDVHDGEVFELDV